MENQSQDPNGPNSIVVATHERYFDAGERREVSIVAERPNRYDAFGFRLRSGEVTVEVENSDDDGRVEVLLMEGTEIADETELLMEANTRDTVTFDTGHELNWDELDFEVQAA